jgi:hypothetical protein
MNQLQRLAQQIARLQVEFMHAKRAAIGTGRVKVIAVKSTVVKRHTRTKHIRIVLTR